MSELRSPWDVDAVGVAKTILGKIFQPPSVYSEANPPIVAILARALVRLSEGHDLTPHLIGAGAENTRLRVALTKACSLLDDAVQLRDDCDAWFAEIDKLRTVLEVAP